MKSLSSKRLKKMGKMKVPGTETSSLGSHRFKMSRGLNRKDMSQVPKKHRTEIEPVDVSPGFADFVRQLNVSNKVVDTAKKASTGVWRVSKAQVYEIAKKYKFNIPDKEDPMKHLGSTGIQLLRYKPGVYYLYKPRRRTRKKRMKSAVGKSMNKFNMGMNA